MSASASPSSGKTGSSVGGQLPNQTTPSTSTSSVEVEVVSEDTKIEAIQALKELIESIKEGVKPDKSALTPLLSELLGLDSFSAGGAIVNLPTLSDADIDPLADLLLSSNEEGDIVASNNADLDGLADALLTGALVTNSGQITVVMTVPEVNMSSAQATEGQVLTGEQVESLSNAAASQ